MLPKRLVRCMSVIVLLTLLQTAVLGQTPAGVVYAEQGAMVNGKAVTGEVGVFAGDKLQTGAAGADLRLEGTLITLHPNSSLILGKTVELGCGAMDFFTFKQAALRVGGADITPVSSDATKLQVINSGGSITIVPLIGETTITLNGQSATLQPGKAFSLAGDSTCPALADERTSPPSPTATTGHRKLIGILVGAGGAGAVAGVLAARRSERPVSPSRP